jgi:hypothetical protein
VLPVDGDVDGWFDLVVCVRHGPSVAVDGRGRAIA